MPGLPQQYGGMGGAGAGGGGGGGAGGFNGAGAPPSAGAAGGGAGSSGPGLSGFPAPVGADGRGGMDGVPPPPSGYSLLDEASSVAVQHRDAPNPLEGIYGRDGGENGAVAAAGGGLPSEGESANGWSRSLPYNGGVSGDDAEGIGKARDADGGKLGVEADTGADAAAAPAGGAGAAAPGEGAGAPTWDRKQEVNKELEWERAHQKEIEEEDRRLLLNFQAGSGADALAQGVGGVQAVEGAPAPAQVLGGDDSSPGAAAPQEGAGAGGRGLRGGKQLSFDEAEQLMSRLQAKHRGRDRKRSGSGDGGSLMRFSGRAAALVPASEPQPPSGADVDLAVAQDRVEHPIQPDNDGPGTGRPMSPGEEQVGVGTRERRPVAAPGLTVPLPPSPTQAENVDVATEEVQEAGKALTAQDEKLNKDAEAEQKVCAAEGQGPASPRSRVGGAERLTHWGARRSRAPTWTRGWTTTRCD